MMTHGACFALGAVMAMLMNAGMEMAGLSVSVATYLFLVWWYYV